MSRRLAAILLLCMTATQASAQTAPAQAGAVFVTLGTGGGPLPRAARAGPANAVIVGGDVYLLDVGPGAVRQLAAAGLAQFRLRAIFLSHQHIDHIGDLAPLLGARWALSQSESVPVYGPPGTATFVAKTLDALSVLETAPIAIGPGPVPKVASSAVGHDLRDAVNPALVYSDERIKVYAIDAAHFHLPEPPGGTQPRSFAYRIEAAGRVFTYTGDTGPTDKLVQLARNSDVLVSEVIDLSGTRRMLASAVRAGPAMDGIMAHMQQDHLRPEDVARIATAAHVKSVVLTHLVPGADGEADTSPYSREVAKGFAGQVTVARDLDRY